MLPIPLFPGVPTGNDFLLVGLLQFIFGGLVGFFVLGHADAKGLHGPTWGILLGGLVVLGGIVGFVVGLAACGVRLVVPRFAVEDDAP